MPRGQKRKRDDEGPKVPPRKSTRQRKKSFGEDFQELYSPPKGNGNGNGDQPDPQPGPSTDPVPEPEPAKNAIT